MNFDACGNLLIEDMFEHAVTAYDMSAHDMKSCMLASDAMHKRKPLIGRTIITRRRCNKGFKDDLTN